MSAAFATPAAPSARGGLAFRGGLVHAHRMPFGPQPVNEADPSAGYHFRLWAPELQRVTLCLHRRNGRRVLHRCTSSEGWHRCEVAEARPGDRYGFVLEDGLEVPDPASRFNPDGVHGPSCIVDPARFRWDEDWHGRPWAECVLYELHVGTFTPEGTYAAAERRLDELAALGITAIELMPLAESSGRRGWGYDGVLPYAPKAGYGTPEELKHFVQAAHRRGLMVFLDVVYNHFGPDGNYLHAYAPQFFTAAHRTPWGGAIAFDGDERQTVRAFFIHNALYWLEEYRFDGLRLDAVHAIFDDSRPHILEEISLHVRERSPGRHVHLVLENVDNRASLLGPPGTPGRFDAQWNDDFHHVAHTLLTGEQDGYYADFADSPVRLLARCLAQGFAYQGEHSEFHGGPRGEPSAGLPPTAFVNFLQNHDQVGNRALGERLTTLTTPQRLRALVALQLLAPQPPLLFMGEETGATTPFLYFCDYTGTLGEAVREGRRKEFAGFGDFSAEDIPDPCAESTFLASCIDWDARARPEALEWLAFYRRLLELRRTWVMPLLPRLVPGGCGRVFAGEDAFELRWHTSDGLALVLAANLADEASPPLPDPGGPCFFTLGAEAGEGRLGPWSVRACVLEHAGRLREED